MNNSLHINAYKNFCEYNGKFRKTNGTYLGLCFYFSVICTLIYLTDFMNTEFNYIPFIKIAIENILYLVVLITIYFNKNQIISKFISDLFMGIFIAFPLFFQSYTFLFGYSFQQIWILLIFILASLVISILLICNEITKFEKGKHSKKYISGVLAIVFVLLLGTFFSKTLQLLLTQSQLIPLAFILTFLISLMFMIVTCFSAFRIYLYKKYNFEIIEQKTPPIIKRL